VSHSIAVVYPLRGAAKYFKTKGCRESKKVEKHWYRPGQCERSLFPEFCVLQISTKIDF